VVVAGLFLGNNERNLAMSEQTQQYLETFWQLIDEILNSLLFLLIGLEILAIKETGAYLVLGLLGIACRVQQERVQIGVTGSTGERHN
jgi:CPA1 family monovalent cation:H+ antiporter